MTEVRCDTCKWWRGIKLYDDVPPNLGRCHRELSAGCFAQTRPDEFCRHHEAPTPQPPAAPDLAPPPAPARGPGEDRLCVGDQVRKIKGYGFPGEVRGVITKRNGEVRIIVECTADEVAGMLHIFNPDQLARLPAPRTTPTLGA